MVQGAGAWGVIHPTYRAYARAVGFHIDACAPRQAQAKGKVEAKVRLSRLLLDPGRRACDSLEELQALTDERVERWAEQALCPATGRTVQESWQQELGRLAPLPLLPEPFDVAVTRPVHPDCTVHFEGRLYSVPFILPAGAWRCAAAPARCRSSATAASCASTPGARPSGSCSTRSATKARRAHGSWRRRRWAGWAGGCRRSTSCPSSSGRWISMPPWRRWRDERAGRQGACRPRRHPPGARAARPAPRRGAAGRDALRGRQAGPGCAQLPRPAARRRADPREERRVKTSLRLSGLPPGQTLGNFDFAFQPAVEQRRLETLATCAWIREHETILIQGPPGVGKTHLAVALGVRAVEHGFSVAFFRLEELLHAMKQDAELSPRGLRRRKYLNVALLIIDEVGFQPLSRQEASLFFRLVSYRYQRGSTLITTNKSVKDWPEILAGDEVMATALLDRLLHHCHVLNIKGRCYRLRDLERILK